VSPLADRLLAIHAALDQASVPHAFGGAIALAYCTEEPRGTRDIDVNVFVPSTAAGRVLAALPDALTHDNADLETIAREDQVRLWWDDTPVDLFFDAHDFHREVAAGVRTVPFAGSMIPVLGCDALVVFKAMLNRTRDWADIEAMVEARTVDPTTVVGWVVRLLGTDHEASERLTALLD
jgi:hypothetical protein